jgi:hypothetical protein
MLEKSSIGLFLVGSGVLTRSLNLLLLFVAIATGSHLVIAQSSNSHLIQEQSAALAGVIENNHGRLRINLTNNSPREFRGTARISLGSDSEQKEIGQVELVVPAQETRIFKLTSVTASGSHFTLAIYHQKGVLVLYQIAPIKSVSDSMPETAVILTPLTGTSHRPNSVPEVNNVSLPASTTGKNNHHHPGSNIVAEALVQARLVADEGETDSFLIAFELSSQQPVKDATLAIKNGQFNDSKPLSLPGNGRQAVIKFKLPDQLENEQISYELANQEGRLLAKGELNLEQLIAGDSVTVLDIRTDRQSYDPGDSAKLIILLEGKSPRGYRIEVSAKDGRGKVFFRDQKQVVADHQTMTQEFDIALPSDLSSPVHFEFKIYDGETKLLFDSGEREISINQAKSSSRPPSI